MASGELLEHIPKNVQMALELGKEQKLEEFEGT